MRWPASAASSCAASSARATRSSIRASRTSWSTATRSARSGQLPLEHGLDGGVLVLGVVDQEGDDVADVAGQARTGDAEARVEAGRLRGDREQLGPDGLVDVAVQVERHRREGRGGQIDEGHGDGSCRVVRRGVRQRRSHPEGAVGCPLLNAAYLVAKYRVTPGREEACSVFDEERTAFLEGGCALILATVLPDGEPHAGPRVGAHGPARRRARAAAARRGGPRHGRSGGRGGAIAITGASVRTLRAVQLKGRALVGRGGVRSMTPPVRSGTARRSSVTSSTPTASTARWSSG